MGIERAFLKEENERFELPEILESEGRKKEVAVETVPSVYLTSMKEEGGEEGKGTSKVEQIWPKSTFFFLQEKKSIFLR